MPPTFVHAKDTKIIVGGYDLTGYLQEAAPDVEVEKLETTVFGDSAKTYIAGLRDGGLDLKGLYDGSANAVHARLKTEVGSVDRLVTYAPEGLTLGYPAIVLRSLASKYAVKSQVGGLIEVSARFDAQAGLGGSIDLNAKSLQPLTAVTGTGNGSSVDNAASSANGGIGVLHVVAFTGTDATIKIQHSADDITYADLVTFTAATGVGAEAVQSAAGTSVNRYLRRNITGTFTSITFALLFARR